MTTPPEDQSPPPAPDESTAPEKASAPEKFSRRTLLKYGVAATGIAALLGGLNGFVFEPQWLKINQIKPTTGKTTHKVVHITDIHYKGDKDYFERVVKLVNAQSPDFVCFTGDLMEKTPYLEPALAILKKIKAPIYGVPGNHDYWSNAPFAPIKKALQATGGDWLINGEVLTADKKVRIVGSKEYDAPHQGKLKAEKTVHLCHYPLIGDYLQEKSNLILAGHSHGGQVRLPLIGPLITPFGVGKYNLGLFQTKSGPLYVSSGIGTFGLKLRFYCRPEIAVMEI